MYQGGNEGFRSSGGAPEGFRKHARHHVAQRYSWINPGFVGYAVIFLARNFTDSFLELGIGPSEVNVGKDEIQAFSPSLYEYVSHLHIAVSGFIAATGVAVLFLVAFGVRRGQCSLAACLLDTRRRMMGS